MGSWDQRVVSNYIQSGYIPRVVRNWFHKISQRFGLVMVVTWALDSGSQERTKPLLAVIHLPKIQRN